MLIKRMLAVFSAITIMGTCSVCMGRSYMFRAYADSETVSDAESETCGVIVSLSSASDPIPEGIKAKLVKETGEETSVIAEWEISQDSPKEITNLEYSEDIRYKILIDEQPDDYLLPSVTDVILNKKGDTDRIALCGAGYTRIFVANWGISDGIGFNQKIVSISSSMTAISAATKKQCEYFYIVDDKGTRYCDCGITMIPDGHYRAVVKPAEGYRFVKRNAEAASAIVDMQMFEKNFDLSYFDQDFENGIEFNVSNGEADKLLNFYIESAPTETNCCTADISVVDSETGELLEGFVFDITNKRTIEESSIKWTSASDSPMKFDKLSTLGYEYTVTSVYVPLQYELSKYETKFEFSEYGEHKDIVINAERVMTDEEAAAVKKVVLPDETPVPIDDKHCAVTVGAISAANGTPIKGATGTLYKKVNKEKIEILEWDAEKEPVKTINDIEFDKNAEYYVKLAGSSEYYRFEDIKLNFTKGGSTDKVVQCMYPYYMRKVPCELSCGIISNGNSLSTGYNGCTGFDITDTKGYRYAYNPTSVIVLPDGDYNIKPRITSKYRAVPLISEMAGVFIYKDATAEKYLENNVESCQNGVNFTVKDGEADKDIRFYTQDIPTSENACSATITVVDEATGKPVEGVKLSLYSPSFNYGKAIWNTSDTPEIKLDDLRFINDEYSISIKQIPDGYTQKEKKIEFKFTEFGQHEDVVIKLERKSLSGDANCDGTVDLADAVLIMQSISNPSRYGIKGDDERRITDEGLKNADCCNTGDGVTNADALAIQKYKLSLVDSLPVEN